MAEVWSFQISIRGTDYRHKAMRIDDDAKDSMRFKKEDLKGN